MERTPVESSSVASVGYDPTLQLLEVEFRDGDVYQYLDVPETTYREFIEADSIGRYLNLSIKSDFDVRKV